MVMTRQVDFLEPIELADHLGKVELILDPEARSSGISKMKLDDSDLQGADPDPRARRIGP